MSFKDHSTHGPASVIGTPDKVYLNHPITLMNNDENKDKPADFYLHCMALNRYEVIYLIGALEDWLRLGGGSCMPENTDENILTEIEKDKIIERFHDLKRQLLSMLISEGRILQITGAEADRKVTEELFEHLKKYL